MLYINRSKECSPSGEGVKLDSHFGYETRVPASGTRTISQEVSGGMVQWREDGCHGSPIWAKSEPIHFHKDNKLVSKFTQEEDRATSCGIPGRLYGWSQDEEGIGGWARANKELGVVLSEEKGSGVTQRAEYLGFVWDASTKTIGVSKERRKQYGREVKNLLRHAQTRKVWRKLIGRLLFLRQAVGPTLRHIRSLLHAVNSNKGQKLVEAVGEARVDLLWWEERLRGTLELPVLKEAATDAGDVAGRCTGITIYIEMSTSLQDKWNCGVSSWE